MSSGADEASESEGTSVDTILRELCMLRCSSCSEGTSPLEASSQHDSVTFNSCLNSAAKDSADYTENSPDPKSLCTSSDSPNSLPPPDKFSDRLLDDYSKQLQGLHTYFNGSSGNNYLLSNPWFKYLHSVQPYPNGASDSHLPSSFWSRHLQSESLPIIPRHIDSLTCHVSSTGTNTPQTGNTSFYCIKRAKQEDHNQGLDGGQQTSSEAESEGSNNVEYLVRERCSSPDCACDKRRPKHFYRPRKTRSRRWLRPRSVSSQVTETSLGLKLDDWNGQVIIQEEDPSSTLDFSRGKRVGMESESSRETVPSILKLCQVSTASENSSESAITFLKKCSDCNILSSLGLQRDQISPQTMMMSDASKLTMGSVEGKSKGQMVETYGKLLHKIEKLKKMTTWKSKRRKNKLKYTLDGTEFSKPSLEHVPSDIDKVKPSSVDGNDREPEPSAPCLSRGDPAADQPPSKEEAFIDLLSSQPAKPESEDVLPAENPVGKTCEIGVQSVDSESFITTVESPIDHYKQKNEPVKEHEDSDVQTVLSHYTKRVAETVKKNVPMNHIARVKSKRARLDSGASLGSCDAIQGNTFYAEESSLNWGGRETQEEILGHLRQINRLIERESCASNSTHRLCKSERCLGFEADKVSSSRRFSKHDKGKSELKSKEGRVYWAVTKVTVYPDSCRTYEVMRLSKRRPQNIPSSSETVFVLLPNK